MRLKLSQCLLAVLLVSCGRDMPTLPDIDIEEWKGDKNGCHGYRAGKEIELRQSLPELKGLSEVDIVQLLGRPDQNELYKRNQKFYYYFVTAAPGCPNASAASMKLILRFNAMGYAQLVSLEQD